MPNMSQPGSLYATFTVAVAVALVVVVTTTFDKGWQVPEREPVVIQAYGKQQESVAALHDAREGDVRYHLNHSGR